MLITCAGCDKPILDKFLLNVLERAWHVDCVRCVDCHTMLADKCFTREGKLFCRADFFRRYGTKCGGCAQGISPSDLVRKARDKVFHLNCFTCLVCRKQLSTGEELYVLDDNKFVCKSDYEAGSKPPPSHHLHHHHHHGHHHHHHHHHHHQQAVNAAAAAAADSGSDDDEDDDNNSTGSTSTTVATTTAAPSSGLVKQQQQQAQQHHLTETNNNNNALSHEQAAAAASKQHQVDQDSDADQNSLDGDAETRDTHTDSNNKSPDGGDSGAGAKRRGPRTTIKAKQLEILKTAFSQTPKPTRHIREQLAKETGLAMRVIQVWFQNKRSKERRLKQLTSMGRGPFFGSTRKMRGFPMNLSPGGLDDGAVAAGFPYFADGKFEFGYAAGPPFHPHDAPYFGVAPPPPPPPPGAMGFAPPDFGGLPPEALFAGGAPDGGPSVPQPQPPNVTANQQQRGGGGGGGGGPSAGSPSEFMGGGAFADSAQQLNEGLVW